MPRKRKGASDPDPSVQKRQKVITHVDDSTALDAVVKKWFRRKRQPWQRQIMGQVCNQFHLDQCKDIIAEHGFGTRTGQMMTLEAHASGTIRQWEAYMRGQSNYMTLACSTPLPPVEFTTFERGYVYHLDHVSEHMIVEIRDVSVIRRTFGDAWIVYDYNVIGQGGLHVYLNDGQHFCDFECFNTQDATSRFLSFGVRQLNARLNHLLCAFTMKLKGSMHDTITLWFVAYWTWMRHVAQLLQTQRYVAQVLDTIILDYLKPCKIAIDPKFNLIDPKFNLDR
jgi:hypothetical protein